jgi:hypothetical protein
MVPPHVPHGATVSVSSATSGADSAVMISKCAPQDSQLAL